MTTERDHVVVKVRQWVAYADEDLRLARHAMEMSEGCPYRLVAYHCQQCVEKYLKAYLVHRGVDFPYTHNVSLLLELCSDTGRWVSNLQDAELLTRYALTTRYPGEDRQVSEDDTKEAIKKAGRVQQVVRAALTDEGVDIP